MSIHSPIEDRLYIRPIRPERRLIRFSIKYYTYIVGFFISLVVISALIRVNVKLLLLALAGYWGYVFLRNFIQANAKWQARYSRPIFQAFRMAGLVLGVTALLFYVYHYTSYLRVIQDDTLWLLYFPAVSAASQRGSRVGFLATLALAILCLFLVHPVAGMTILLPVGAKWAFSLEFIIKTAWLVFLSLTSYILMRYMGDTVADLNLIITVQNRMRALEGSLLKSKFELTETKFLENAVEVIRKDLSFDHVNIFQLDKYCKKLVCVAGACEQGKQLARSGYSVELAGKGSIIGHVVSTRTPYVSNDVAHDPYYLSHQAFPDIRAELAVPIIVRHRLFGVLDIEVHQRDFFLDQDRKALEILANHIGWVIDNSGQFDHISWINRMIETIAAPIFTQNHLDETLQEIANSAVEELDADLVFLFSYDSSSRDKISSPIYAGPLLHPELIDPASVDPDNVVNRLLPDSELIYVNEDLDKLELEAHPLFKASQTHVQTGRPTFIEREKIRSNAIIRLMSNGRCVGFLLLNFRQPRTFTELDKKRYFSFAHLAALAIQKMHLQEHIIQKEKNDVSNLIHDILIGDSIGLHKILRSIEMPAERGLKNNKMKLDLAIEATEHLHNDIRWINRLLKESASDDLMLELDKLFLLFKQVFNVEATHKWSGDTRLISPTLSRELSIVIREALTNAVRHGNARNVVITGLIKSKNMSASIVDDGVGFIPKQVVRMNGVLSMKYRIEEMGGSFKLTSNPGKGTKISINVPLQISTEVKHGQQNENTK